MSGGGSATDFNQRSRLSRTGWIPVLWYILFLIGPLLLVFATSTAARGVYGGIDWHSIGFASFGRAIDPLYAIVIGRSLWLSLLTSSLCFAIGLPMALAMATQSSRIRSVTVFAMAVPFLTNLMIRICALKSFVAYDGPVAQVLTALGFTIDRFALSQNLWLVLYGMVSSYLPFMVFPLYGALERFDFALVEAAQDLGANYWQVLTRVIVPALRRAIVSGVLLVFIPAFGEFVIPDLLGGAKAMLIGNLISEQFLKARDWPFGAALSVFLMIGLAIAIALIRAFERPLSSRRFRAGRGDATTRPASTVWTEAT